MNMEAPWNELPIDYLRWMARNDWDDETTYTLNHELERRRQAHIERAGGGQ